MNNPYMNIRDMIPDDIMEGMKTGKYAIVFGLEKNPVKADYTRYVGITSINNIDNINKKYKAEKLINGKYYNIFTEGKSLGIYPTYQMMLEVLHHKYDRVKIVGVPVEAYNRYIEIMRVS